MIQRIERKVFETMKRKKEKLTSLRVLREIFQSCYPDSCVTYVSTQKLALNLRYTSPTVESRLTELVGWGWIEREKTQTKVNEAGEFYSFRKITITGAGLYALGQKYTGIPMPIGVPIDLEDEPVELVGDITCEVICF